MDVSFLKNNSYFHKNSLQGGKKEVRDNFWDLFLIPLPNTILNIAFEIQSGDVFCKTIEMPSKKLQNIDVSSIGRETLQMRNIEL